MKTLRLLIIGILFVFLGFVLTGCSCEDRDYTCSIVDGSPTCVCNDAGTSGGTGGDSSSSAGTSGGTGGGSSDDAGTSGGTGSYDDSKDRE